MNSNNERIITTDEIQAVLNLLAGVTAFSALNLGEYVKVIDRLRSLPPLVSELNIPTTTGEEPPAGG